MTFGHGTASQADLVRLLTGAEVGVVVDVRRFPGSRRHPHVATDELDRWLPEAGIGYRWESDLGGRRRTAPEDSGQDPWWEVQAFRAYAAYTRTPQFTDAVTRLLRADDDRRTAIMCSESVWWRCHRRLIADVAVLLYDVAVHHLAHDGRLSPHLPAAGARVVAGQLQYDRPR